MTDHLDPATALARTTAQLPAKAELVARGVTLAERLLTAKPTSLRSIVDEQLTNARRDWTTALGLWEDARASEDRRQALRNACLSAYRWGLLAAMTAYVRCPSSVSEPDVITAERFVDEAYVINAQWLVEERFFEIDVQPALDELLRDAFDPEELVINVETFLNEVARAAEAQFELFEVTLPKLGTLLDEDALEATRTGRPRLTIEEALRKLEEP